MKKSCIETAIFQIEEEIKKSILEKNRSGDYRIGLRKAINICANLTEMHNQEIIGANIKCTEKCKLKQTNNLKIQ